MKESPTLIAAREYLGRGWTVVPVLPRDKKITVKGWEKVRLTEADLPKHFSNGNNLGVHFGTPSNGVVDVDLDSPEVLALADYLLPTTESVFGRKSKPRSHRLYRLSSQTDYVKLTDPLLTKEDEGHCLVELRQDGHQTIVPPSEADGEIRGWDKDGEPAEMDSDLLRLRVHCLGAAALLVRYWPASDRHEARMALSGWLGRSKWTEENTAAFIQSVIRVAQPGDREAYAKVIGDTRAAFAKLERNEKVTGFARLAGTIDKKIMQQVSEWLGISKFSDDAANSRLGNEGTSNGERFAEQHTDKVRYWPDRKLWLLWTNTHWQTDKLRDIRELAKQTGRGIYAEAASIADEGQRNARIKWATASLQMNGLRDMLESASSLKQMKVATEQIDASHWLLNFQNGTVDLRDGKLREHRRGDYITKIARCNYTPGVLAPRWIHFVQQTFGEEVAGWIQKAVGYSLTGITSEKVTFLLIGLTNTGKSTFLEILRTLFEDYSKRLQVESLMWNKGRDNNSEADIADLHGVRLAITSETEEDHRLRESKLKQITQGMGTIRAARKYENHIEFPETHHLWFDANHRPGISGTDDAIWNRLIPIPCAHQLKPEEIDRSLKEKLLLEAEAIAAWVVEGAVRWKTETLYPLPTAVEELRKEWRENADIIGQFIDECCETPHGCEERAGDLYMAFELWAKENGYYVLTGTAFGNRMNERGFEKYRGDVPKRLGIVLKSEWRTKVQLSKGARHGR